RVGTGGCLGTRMGAQIVSHHLSKAAWTGFLAVPHRFRSYSTQPFRGQRRHPDATVPRPLSLRRRGPPIWRGDPEINLASIQRRLGLHTVELEGGGPLKKGHCLGNKNLDVVESGIASS